MSALADIVRQGKALYVGVSQYDAGRTRQAGELLRSMGTRLFIHQPRYSMLDRWVEDGLLDELENQGTGSIVFSPLEQGVLTNKYLKGIPADSRAAKDGRYLKADQLKPELLEKVRRLNDIAESRGQSLAQMAIAWLLKDERVTSVLVGVSRVSQLLDNIAALDQLEFDEDTLRKIEEVLEG